MEDISGVSDKGNYIYFFVIRTIRDIESRIVPPDKKFSRKTFYYPEETPSLSYIIPSPSTYSRHASSPSFVPSLPPIYIMRLHAENKKR